jgi:uncharacterized membrane protein
MTFQDLEHRLDGVESQHADYVRVLSAHTSTFAVLVAELAAVRQTLGTVVAEIATLRQGQERIEAFLRQKLNGKGAGE